MSIVWSEIHVYKLLTKCINCVIKLNKPMGCSYRVLRKNVTHPATGSRLLATMAPYIHAKSLAHRAHIQCIFWPTEDRSWDSPVEMRTVINHLEFEKTLFLGFIYFIIHLKHKDSFGKSENLSKVFFAEMWVFHPDNECKSSRRNGLLWIAWFYLF